MYPKLPRLILCVAIASACATLATRAAARSEEWKNAKGETFKAEPSELLGPWALFDDGTLVPLSMLSEEDSVRFYQGLKDLEPARSDGLEDGNQQDQRGALRAPPALQGS
jgi:hypothetical protein